MKLSIIKAFVAALACASCGESGAGAAATPAAADTALDPSGTGATVFVRVRADGDRVVADVVARGAGSIRGAAFRLLWDAEALAFESAKSGPAWPLDILALAKEGTPGQLAVAWTEKGREPRGVDTSREVVLGSVTFTRTNPRGSALTFRPERSVLVGKNGVTITAGWRGGGVRPL